MLPSKLRKLNKRRQKIVCKRYIEKSLNDALLELLRGGKNIINNESGLGLINKTIERSYAKLSRQSVEVNQVNFNKEAKSVSCQVRIIK